MKRPDAVVLGAGLNALWVARSLGRRGVSVTVVEDVEDDIAYHSRFVLPRRVTATDGRQPLVEQILESADPGRPKPVLFPTSDYWLKFSARHSHRLEAHFHMVLPPVESVELVVEKEKFREYSETHGVPVPRTWVPESRSELRSLLPELSLPLVIKPSQSLDWQNPEFQRVFGYKKMFLATSHDQLLQRWKELERFEKRLVIQEFISGDDTQHFSFVSYRNRENRELASLCVRKRRLLPIHAGASTFAEVGTDPEGEIPWKAREVLEDLRYIGPSSVCFKRDERTGESRIFEINGRLPLCHSILQMVGIDFPWLMYQDALGLPTDKQEAGDTRGTWSCLAGDFQAFREYRAAGELPLREWLVSYRNTRMVVEFAADDLGPFLHLMKSAGRAVMAKLRRSVSPHSMGP